MRQRVHMLVYPLLLGVSLLTGAIAQEPAAEAPAGEAPADAGAAWEAMKVAWAREHLELAGWCLSQGEFGFADTQAGMARQLVGEGDAGVAAYASRRAGTRRHTKGWNTAHWRAYEQRRGRMHEAHAAAAAAILNGAGGAPEESAAEIESWALRLDPDQAVVRARRGEERVEGLGWLPAEVARELGAGKVRFQDTWERPAPAKYASFREAYELPTEHFLVRATVPYATARSMAADLEALFHVWAELLEGIRDMRFYVPPPHWTNTKRIPTIWILRTREDYLACVEAENEGVLPRARNCSGLALNLRVAFFYTAPLAGAVGTLRHTLLHEGTHLIGFSIVRMEKEGLPGVLFMEGVAEAMGILQAEPEISLDVASRLQASTKLPFLARARSSRLDPAVVDMEAAPFARGEVDLYYGHALAVAHYLLFGGGGGHREALLRHLLVVQSGLATERTYDEHFPDLTREQLAEGVADYIRTAR